MTSSILLRIASDDRAAVSECIRTYGGLVWSMARRMSRTTEDAEDATQEIFLEIWRCAKRFDLSLGSEYAFIATIARRRLIDRLRKSLQEPSMQLVDLHEIVDDASPVLGSPLDVGVATHVLSLLRPLQRQMLELSLLHGFSHAAIAKRLDLPLGTVKSCIRRGLLHARELVGQSRLRSHAPPSTPPPTALRAVAILAA